MKYYINHSFWDDLLAFLLSLAFRIKKITAEVAWQCNYLGIVLNMGQISYFEFLFRYCLKIHSAKKQKEKLYRAGWKYNKSFSGGWITRK